MELFEFLNKSAHTVVYPCAGRDWMAITFTTKEFLESRIRRLDNGYEIIHERFREIEFFEPDTLVYIDNNKEIDFYSKYSGFDGILFEDSSTKIEDLGQENLETGAGYGISFACKHTINWISKRKPEWSYEGLVPKRKNIIFVNAEWKYFSYELYNNNTPTYIGIGVTDGCRFGGNNECVNKLSYDYDKYKPNILNVNHSKYWITDHFSDSNGILPNFRDMHSGYVIHAYPFSFRKISSLLPMWGHYGGRWDGATLFEILN